MRDEFNRLRDWFAALDGPGKPTFAPGRPDASGPLAELFQTVNGQVSGGPIFDAFELLSFADAQSEKSMMDAMARDEPWTIEWWDPHWHPFASDGAGQLLVIDERDGRVIEFVHDDDSRPVLAPTLSSYLADVNAKLESGALVYDAEAGVISPAELANYRYRQQDARVKRSESVGTNPTGALLVLMAVLAAWFAVGIGLQLGETAVPFGALLLSVATLIILNWLGWVEP